MKEINWGIIGCGDVTELKSGPAFNRIPQSKLAAVMRRNGVKAADYARRHNVPRWYERAEDLLADPAINAIYIATPPAYHLSYGLAALEAGKQVYMEKPMALNAAEARQLEAAAMRTGLKMTIAHYRRQLPLFLKIKDLIDNGVIGRIRLVDLKLMQSPAAELVASNVENWRTQPQISGGGLFHDLAPHQLDMMLYLFGPVASCNGFSANQAQIHDADDLVSGRLVFENGIVFNGLWAFHVDPSNTTDHCTIYGERGSLSFGFFGDRLSLNQMGSSEDFSFEMPRHVQEPMIRQVVDYFLDRAPNPCSADLGVETLRLMDCFTQTAIGREC
ncbi:Gfo/Idh/MocA family oxidoreductase [Niabella terrae]